MLFGVRQGILGRGLWHSVSGAPHAVKQGFHGIASQLIWSSTTPVHPLAPFMHLAHQVLSKGDSWLASFSYGFTSFPAGC